MNTLNTSLHHIIDEGSDQQTLQALCKSMGRDGLIRAGLPADLADSISKSLAQMRGAKIPKIVYISDKLGRQYSKVVYTSSQQAMEDIRSGKLQGGHFETQLMPDNTIHGYDANGKAIHEDTYNDRVRIMEGHQKASRDAKHAYAHLQEKANREKGTTKQVSGYFTATSDASDEQWNKVVKNIDAYNEAVQQVSLGRGLEGNFSSYKFTPYKGSGGRNHTVNHIAARDMTPADVQSMLVHPLMTSEGNRGIEFDREGRTMTSQLIWGEKLRLAVRHIHMDGKNSPVESSIIMTAIPIDHIDDKEYMQFLKTYTDNLEKEVTDLNKFQDEFNAEKALREQEQALKEQQEQEKKAHHEKLEAHRQLSPSAKKKANREAKRMKNRKGGSK